MTCDIYPSMYIRRGFGKMASNFVALNEFLARRVTSTRVFFNTCGFFISSLATSFDIYNVKGTIYSSKCQLVWRETTAVFRDIYESYSCQACIELASFILYASGKDFLCDVWAFRFS